MESSCPSKAGATPRFVAQDRAAIARSANATTVVQLAAYHDIHDKDSDVTKRASTSTQVGEGFVSGGIDDEKTRNLVLLLAILEDSQQVVPSCDATKNFTLFMTAVLVLIASTGKYVAPICCVIPPASPS